LELRHLRYFVACAESGGIARAADRLGVAQPALSRQIRDLENEMNVKLFERTKQGAKLTYPGEVFLADVQRLMDDLKEAQFRASLAQAGKFGALRVCLVESFSWHDVVVDSIHSFRLRNPEVALNVSVMPSPEQLTALREGRISAGFLFDRPRDDDSLEGVEILNDPVWLAVHERSHWAKHPPRRLAELADETFYWFTRRMNPAFYDILMAACQKSGLAPRMVEGGSTDSTNLSFVAAGLGCTFLSAQAKWRKPRNVKIVPVGDLKIIRRMELVWRKDNQQPALRNFIEMFRAPRAKGTLAAK
jgi:DNA-binding transcriptional LysR family regulator